MLAIIKLLKVKKYYNKKIRKIQEDNFIGDNEIDNDSMDVICEMAWKYYEAEISRGNKIISKAKTYCSAVGLTLSIFSFASKDTIISLKNYNCYNLFLIFLFMITIGYFLLAAISSLSAIKLTNVHKIGEGDIVSTHKIATENQCSNGDDVKKICRKHMVNKLILYTKLNEQIDNAMATYVGIAQEAYRNGIIVLVIFLAMVLIF